jgi:hypothetical protein
MERAMVGQRASQAAFAALQDLAGRYAGLVARLWPVPYDGYRRLPAARRHLVHIVAPRIGREARLDATAFARDLETVRMRELIPRWAPDAPHALVAALGKLGERAWTPALYRRLLVILAEGGPATVTLRHAPAINPEFVEALATLPAALRGLATARWVRDTWDAQLVVEAMTLAAVLGGGAARADALVERLSRAKDRARFFEMLVDELRPRTLAEPVRETAELRPLRTVAEVRDAGRRFRNCLASCAHRAVFGAAAFVEWRGGEPAVMELEHEGAAGWRLVTVLGVDNRSVTPHTLRLVHEALAAQGVRLGLAAGFLLAEIDAIVEDERRRAEQARASAACAVAAE